MAARAVVEESHSNSWHAQAPVQNVWNLRISMMVCVCVYSNGYYLKDE